MTTDEEVSKLRQTKVVVWVPEGVPGVCAGYYTVGNLKNFGVVKTTCQVRGELTQDGLEFVVEGDLLQFDAKVGL